MASHQRSYNLENMESGTRRGYWANKQEFLLACFGNAWGFSAWARFPYLAYKYRGFFLAYFIMLVHIGFPMLILEMVIGQYSSQGVSSICRMCPLFYGVGITIFLYVFVLLFFMVPIYSWSAFYMHLAFTREWKSCTNSWNSPGCIEGSSSTLDFLNASDCESLAYEVKPDGLCYNKDSQQAVAIHDGEVHLEQLNTTIKWAPAVSEYLSNYIMASGTDFEITELSQIQIAFLAGCWVLIFLMLGAGVHSYGKVVYVTSTLPLLLLVVFLIRVLTLPGAFHGLEFLFFPDYDRLTLMSVWEVAEVAATDVIFGLGLGYGGYLTLSSYNNFRNTFVLDSILVIAVNIAVRLMASVIVFGLLGYHAEIEGTSINNIAHLGATLIFSVIPQALSHVPASTAWTFLFYFLVFMMSLGQVMTTVEVLMTAICDLCIPLQRLRFRVVLVALSCVVFFLLGILFCTRAGRSQLMTAIDFKLLYPAPIIICAMCVCVLFYGIYRLRLKDDYLLMFGDRHRILVVIMALFVILAAFHWFVLPISSLVYLGWMAHEHNTYSFLYEKVYEYISFAIVGIILLPMVLCPIVIIAIAAFRNRWADILLPTKKWGPQLECHRAKATHLPHCNVASDDVHLAEMANLLNSQHFSKCY